MPGYLPYKPGYGYWYVLVVAKFLARATRAVKPVLGRAPCEVAREGGQAFARYRSPPSLSLLRPVLHGEVA